MEPGLDGLLVYGTIFDLWSNCYAPYSGLFLTGRGDLNQDKSSVII